MSATVYGVPFFCVPGSAPPQSYLCAEAVATRHDSRFGGTSSNTCRRFAFTMVFHEYVTYRIFKL